ncbi:MAG: RIP metalloprotease RseP [Gemmatimonadota bacterium]|nr:RIP metalloprotease RseP [Gemmatimonadota bacterium]MDH3422620.1 RIP metalloprotease RseP [Gemmatimonadota bacterium]
MTILATIIVLGVLIFVHELGHFGAAKLVGIEVQRFSIGLGPKVFGFKMGETDYVLSAIPLGGYVKMGGMDDEVMERVEGGAPETPRVPSERDFDSKPIWARTFVISAGVIMNMLFAFATYTFVAAQWGIPGNATTRIGQIEATGLPAGAELLATAEPGSRIVRIGDQAVQDWDGVVTGLLEATPGSLSIELVEPLRSIEIVVPDEQAGRLALAQSVLPWIESGVGFVLPGTPAEDGGLEVGDRITSVAGTPVQSWYDLVREIEGRSGERVELELVREGRPLTRAVMVGAEEERRGGTSVVVGKIGIQGPNPPVTFKEASAGEAIARGYGDTVYFTGVILGFLRDLVTGGVSPRSVGSIVTIGEASGQAAEAGFDVFLRFMALFSVNLAVLNLLPIPVLDGGHLVFLGIEAVRGGRALSVEQRLRWSNVGFVLLLGIMLWALSNDFLRLLGI